LITGLAEISALIYGWTRVQLDMNATFVRLINWFQNCAIVNLPPANKINKGLLALADLILFILRGSDLLC
jgi:hypothetical protein